MRIDSVDRKQNFEMAWNSASKRKVADLISLLRVKGKTEKATKCIELVRDIDEFSPNHTVQISGVVNYAKVFADSHLAKDSSRYGMSLSKLPKSLEKINTFIALDNIRIERLKEKAREIIQKLELNSDKTICGAGWHLKDNSSDKLGRIAEKIALLGEKPKRKNSVNATIEAFNRIENNTGDYRVYCDNKADIFRIFVFGETKELKTIKDNGNILKTFKKIEKVIDKDMKKKQIEQRREELLEVQDRLLLKALGLRNRILRTIFDNKLLNNIKETFENFKTKIKDQLTAKNDTIKQVRAEVDKELGIARRQK